MSAIVRQLYDKAKNKIYPVTRSKCVYMDNGRTTIDQAIADMQDGDTTIEFVDGEIITTIASGNKITTSFNDGVITEVCRDVEGLEVYTKTTSFEDGKIVVKIVYPEGD